MRTNQYYIDNLSFDADAEFSQFLKKLPEIDLDSGFYTSEAPYITELTYMPDYEAIDKYMAISEADDSTEDKLNYWDQPVHNYWNDADDMRGQGYTNQELFEAIANYYYCCVE